MRIIGGKHRHRRFTVPKTFNARPTTDFAKENLFNLLSNRIDFEETKALDLFSGTGSIAVELLSRGCPAVASVEMRRQHYLFIMEVVEKLGEKDHFKLYRADVLSFLKRGVKRQPFDLIFADPPYQMEELPLLPELVEASGLLSPGGLFVLEHPENYHFDAHPWFDGHRSYGSVNFSFFVRKTDAKV